MAVVFFPPQMHDLTGGAEQVITHGVTLRDVLRSLNAQYAGLYARVVAGDTIAPGWPSRSMGR